MQVDITAEGAPQKIIAACCERFGTVDILVNNAGICKLNKVLDFGRADWDPMIDVNLTAAFELSYEAAKIMIPQKSGKIINICSLFSYLGGQWSPAYSATKHALAGFTKAYCDELGQYNWQVDRETCYTKWRYLGTDCGMCISACPFSQNLETIKNAETFKGDDELIKKALMEYKKKFGQRVFVPGNPAWLR